MESRKPTLFYGWVIVATCFISLLLVWGARTSFSVFYVAILDEFGWGRASTALIFSVFLLVYGLSSPLVGMLTDRISPRGVIPIGAVLLALGSLGCSRAQAIWQFYLFWGVVASLGISLAGYVPHTVAISRWFSRRRGTALGIIGSATGLGTAAAILVQYLIQDIGWRTTYFVFCLIFAFVLIPLALLFQRSRPEDMGLLPDGTVGGVDSDKVAKEAGQADKPQDRQWSQGDRTLFQAMRSHRFWALFVCFFFLNGFCIAVMITHQVALAVDLGYSPIFAASVFGLYGLIMALGQLCGFLSDRLGKEKAYTLGCVAAIIGLFALFMTKGTSHPWLLYVYAVSFGFGVGMVIPSAAGAAADLFAGRNFGAIWGFILLGFGVGGALGPWLGGYLFDKTGSYQLTLIISMVANAIACLSMWIAGPRITKRERLVDTTASMG